MNSETAGAAHGPPAVFAYARKAGTVGMEFIKGKTRSGVLFKRGDVTYNMETGESVESPKPIRVKSKVKHALDSGGIAGVGDEYNVTLKRAMELVDKGIVSVVDEGDANSKGKK